ncbi:response regulator [Desulfosporosinus sp. SYSU MS00001]|uniref:response regulator n=1 Tax=Desulfosporosinus sp. SYSU MS00001 TaxID=3416284 RepID=UPI003CF0975A
MAKILVIEDNPAIGLVIQMTLTDQGHQVELRKNALDGLTLMRNGTIPDLILTDLIMKEITGKDLVRIIRGDHLLHDLPVVIVTGCFPDSKILPDADEFQGLLMKPFDINDLVTIVANLTSTRAA